jgi:hypothetical protein
VLAAVLGWPFAGLAAVPLLLHAAYQRGVGWMLRTGAVLTAVLTVCPPRCGRASADT